MNFKIITVICASIILIGILFWPTLYRYDTLTVNNTTLPVKINRLTGSVEHYHPGYGWVSPQGQKSKKGKSIPEKEITKISVKQIENVIDYSGHNVVEEILKGSGSKEFNVEIYNGSEWTITDIVFEFRDNEEKVIKLIGSSTIHPLTIGKMSMQRTGVENVTTMKINDIKGYKD